MLIRRTALLFIALAMAVGYFAEGVRAQYPEKPITMIVPLGAGGSHDRNARVFTSVVPEYLGNAIIVKLMPGASGQTGTAAAASAPADGYTLLFTHNYFDQLQQHVANLPYDTTEDFVTVAQMNSNDASLIVRSDSETLEELVSYAKENPGQLKFAHSGVWGAVHVPAMQFFKEADIEVTMVPYKGGGPAMRGFLAGEADFTMQFPSTILAQGDKVRVLASGGTETHFEGVPTFGELGYSGDLGQMARIIMAPRGIPEDRLAKLREALAKVNEDETYQGLISRIGENLNFIDGEEYEKVRPKQRETYKELVQSLAK